MTYPNTELYLLKNITIDSENKVNTYGMSDITQLELFLGGSYVPPTAENVNIQNLIAGYNNVVWMSPRMSYIYNSQSYVDVPVQLEMINACNYLVYRNALPQDTTAKLETTEIEIQDPLKFYNDEPIDGKTWWDTKYVYASITRFEPQNANCTRVHFEIDAFTTFLSKCTFANSYILREHDDMNKPWNYDFISEEWGGDKDIDYIKTEYPYTTSGSTFMNILIGAENRLDEYYDSAELASQEQQNYIANTVLDKQASMYIYAITDTQNQKTILQNFLKAVADLGVSNRIQFINEVDNRFLYLPFNINNFPAYWFIENSNTSVTGSGVNLKYLAGEVANNELVYNLTLGFSLDDQSAVGSFHGTANTKTGLSLSSTGTSTVALTGQFVGFGANGALIFTARSVPTSTDDYGYIYLEKDGTITGKVPGRGAVENNNPGSWYVDTEGEKNYAISVPSTLVANIEQEQTITGFLTPPAGASAPRNNKTYASYNFYLCGNNAVQIPTHVMTNSLNLKFGVSSILPVTYYCYISNLDGISLDGSKANFAVTYEPTQALYRYREYIDTYNQTRDIKERQYNLSQISNAIGFVGNVASFGASPGLGTGLGVASGALNFSKTQLEMDAYRNSLGHAKQTVPSIPNTSALEQMAVSRFSLRIEKPNYIQFKAIDDFYSLYGYQVNRTGLPKFVNHATGFRQYWNYCKGNIQFKLNAPLEYKKQIEAAFADGVRLWNSQGNNSFGAGNIGFYSRAIDSANPNM